MCWDPAHRTATILNGPPSRTSSLQNGSGSSVQGVVFDRRLEGDPGAFQCSVFLAANPGDWLSRTDLEALAACQPRGHPVARQDGAVAKIAAHAGIVQQPHKAIEIVVHRRPQPATRQGQARFRARRSSGCRALSTPHRRTLCTAIRAQARDGGVPLADAQPRRRPRRLRDLRAMPIRRFVLRCRAVPSPSRRRSPGTSPPAQHAADPVLRANTP